MAAITLSKAIQVFGKQVGFSEGRECLIDDITVQVEWCLLNAGGELWREWHLTVRNGLFSFPYDLETPLKYRWSNSPGVGVEVFNSPFYSYSSGSLQNCCGFSPFGPQTSCEVLANRTPVQFQPPVGGGFIMITTTNPLDIGKKIEVSGNQRGFAIAPIHFGVKTAGEVLTIYAQDDPNKKHSQFIFEEISAVTKDLTCDYTMLSGITTQGTPFFLSHYHPDETNPLYQQGCFRSCPCGTGCDAKVHMLGRINPSIRYIRDEEVLPITSFEMLELLAKRCRYDKSSDFDKVAVQEARLASLIRRQIFYQQKTGQDVSFDLKGSGATLSNV